MNADSLELAMELIKRKAAKFEPENFKDQYEAAVRELVEAKIKHLPVPKEEEVAPRRGQVINLMDALRKSVGGGETAAPVKKPAASEKPEKAAGAKKGISLVKSSSKRKSA